MRIVKFHKTHIPILYDICKRMNNYPMPDLTSPLIVVRASVEDEHGNIIGAGFIKLTAEFIAFVEPSLSPYKKAEVIFKMTKIGRDAAYRKGLDQLHAFVYHMPTFYNFLRRKLGFQPVTARVLVDNLGANTYGQVTNTTDV